MALQQLITADTNNNAWFKTSAVKMMCLLVAGLLFTAILYNRSSTGSGSQQTNLPPVSKQVLPATGGGGNVREKQCGAEPSFSLMPGGLTRFLQ